MCNLGANVAELKKLFDEYAGREGNTDTLCKSELKQLLTDKMGPGLKCAKNPDKVDKIFEHMDKNGDGEVDFVEFMKAVGVMASAVNGWKCDMSKCNK